MSGPRMRHGNIALLNALFVLAGCGSLPGQPSVQAQERGPVCDVPATPAWGTFLRRYDAAVKYFNEYGTWGSPATQEQDEKVDVELSEALAGVAALTQDGRLSQAELSLVREEVSDIDRLGARRSRTVETRGGGLVHTDHFPAWPGMRAYQQLRMRVPLLKEVSNQDQHNRTVFQWASRKIRYRALVLARAQVRTNLDAMNRIDARGQASSRPAVAAAELRQQVLSLVLGIEGNACPQPTR